MYQQDLATALLAVAARFPDRPALWARGQRLRYADLFRDAGRIARRLRQQGLAPGDRVGILSHRGVTAYAGILGALLAGCTYVPLNTRFPPERNAAMLARAGARGLVLDDRCAALGAKVLGPVPPGLVVLRPESDASLAALPEEPDPALASGDAAGLAYILFTSGTTGEPKGVAISHANLAAYLAAQFAYAPIAPEDRVLQAVELTFDISVLDMFTCWIAGAELVVAPENSALLTPRLIAEREVTATCLVPSTAIRTQAAGMLRPGSMPSLRMCIFGGEAVPVPAMRAWQEAAPNAAIWSLYGPTELTIAVTHTPYRRAAEPALPFMPLGAPHQGTRIALRDPESGTITREGPGEIIVAGGQVSPGYWRNPALDAERFLLLDGARWYRTGDIGRWTPEHGFLFAGRADRQVKIRGFRVELLEVEGTLRRASGCELVAVLPWPATAPGSADGILGFLAAPARDPQPILEACRALMPDYMVPARLVFLPELPSNENGKTDYKALERLAAEGA